VYSQFDATTPQLKMVRRNFLIHCKQTLNDCTRQLLSDNPEPDALQSTLTRLVFKNTIIINHKIDLLANTEDGSVYGYAAMWEAQTLRQQCR
jgi:hypothetical protein